MQINLWTNAMKRQIWADQMRLAVPFILISLLLVWMLLNYKFHFWLCISWLLFCMFACYAVIVAACRLVDRVQFEKNVQQMLPDLLYR